MMTCMEVYKLALALMNMTMDDADYDDSTVLGMLSVMGNEVKDVSDSVLSAQGLAVSGDVPVFTAMTDVVPLADKISRSVLPYGLAAKLMLEDDTTMASYFNAEYNQRLAQYMKPGIGTIEDVY